MLFICRVSDSLFLATPKSKRFSFLPPCVHFVCCWGVHSSLSYKMGLVCKSGCHGCPALHRRTGPLAPNDNHSLAEGHRCCPTLASNHLLCCWSAHKSLAPRTRTLLGVLGHATLNFVAVATLLFFFFCECPKFCDLAKQRRKIFWGVSEVGKINFALYFFWLCVFFLVFYFFLLRSRDATFVNLGNDIQAYACNTIII